MPQVEQVPNSTNMTRPPDPPARRSATVLRAALAHSLSRRACSSSVGRKTAADMRQPAYTNAIGIVALCCSAAVCEASESANEQCDAPDGQAINAGFSATPVSLPAWGLSALMRYVDRAADDAWQHVLSQGISGQVTVVFMACICLWLLGQMAHRPRSSCALLLTWFGWVAWSIYSERLTWDAMETRTYNVYTQTHLCTQQVAPPAPALKQTVKAADASVVAVAVAGVCPQSGWPFIISSERGSSCSRHLWLTLSQWA